MREMFTEGVAESVCEYNIGSMQKGDGVKLYDPDDEDEAARILVAVRDLEPGEAVVIVRSKR